MKESVYLPRLIVSPKVMKDRKTEQTVPMGLNMDTSTGPLFFIAHALKLTHAPPMMPPYETVNLTKLENNLQAS